jgi:hypothetical protein
VLLNARRPVALPLTLISAMGDDTLPGQTFFAILTQRGIRGRDRACRWKRALSLHGAFI